MHRARPRSNWRIIRRRATTTCCRPSNRTWSLCGPSVTSHGRACAQRACSISPRQPTADRSPHDDARAQDARKLHPGPDGEGGRIVRTPPPPPMPASWRLPNWRKTYEPPKKTANIKRAKCGPRTNEAPRPGDFHRQESRGSLVRSIAHRSTIAAGGRWCRNRLPAPGSATSRWSWAIALQNATLYRCVSMISADIAKMRLKLMEQVGRVWQETTARHLRRL